MLFFLFDIQVVGKVGTRKRFSQICFCSPELFYVIIIVLSTQTIQYFRSGEEKGEVSLFRYFFLIYFILECMIPNAIEVYFKKICVFSETT